MEDQTPYEDTPFTTRTPTPTILVWTTHNILSTLFGVLSVLGYVHTNNAWDTYTAKDWVCALITIMPMVTFMMLLSVDEIRAYLTRYLIWVIEKERGRGGRRERRVKEGRAK
jgi:hypothetical protein